MLLQETIDKYGFIYSGQCSTCGGGVTKWSKGDYILYLKKKRHTFRLREKAKYITQWEELKNLDETLKKNIPA